MKNLKDKTKEQLILEVMALRAEVESLKRQSKDASGQSDILSRVILNEMYQFVALLDFEGNILEVNKTALQGAGITLSDIVHQPFWNAKWWQAFPEYQKKLKKEIKQAQQGEFIRYEVQIFGGDAGKEIIWIDFSIIPVRNELNQIIYLLAEGRNITEKKQAEAQISEQNQKLRLLYEKLKEFDELKTQFFANVSHELRTPLALILGPIQQVLANQSLTGEEQQSLEVVERNARILLKQVNDLLDIAKLEAGKMEARFAETDLAGLVKLMASNFEALANDKAIIYNVNVPATLPAEIDPEKIQRVVLNLLSNAFKFTPVQGKINCTLEEKEEKAVLKVADSGPGVSEQNRHLIFERFRQLEGGSTRKFGGTGLGLAIVKDFLDMHQGSISVHDAAEGGALFIIELPLKAPQHVQVHKSIVQDAGYVEDLTTPLLSELKIANQSLVESSADLNLPLVLVVEDNPDLNLFISQTLAQNYRVVSAMDGEEGLEKAVRIQPDLIVSDVMMPRMSGDQLVEALRKLPEMDFTPIIMLTAKADESLRLKMLSGGVQDYLLKPFSAEEVKARVKNLVQMKKAREVLQKELNSKQDDISVLLNDLILAKQEQEISNAKLKQINNDLDSFIYIASHDLKAPITNIEGLFNVLNKRLEHQYDEKDKAIRKMIEDSILKFRATIMHLTEISKVQNYYNSNKELLSFRQVIDDVLEDVNPLINEAGAEVKLDLEVDEVYFAPKNLRSIIYNLISNGIKYRSMRETPVVQIITCKKEDKIIMEVKDNGLGIAQEQLPKLFTMFKRLHSHIEGTGVGLYMIKRMIENGQGSIEVESDLEKGSTFRVIFQA